jgi:nucleoside 2-deoxyribosyltransferase
MKIYVAGPYSDRPGKERPGDIEEGVCLDNLRINYPQHEFVRPYDIICNVEDPTHADNMLADCKELLCCDAIVLRPGWSTSKGVMIELNLAVGTGRPVYTYLDGYMFDEEGNLEIPS